MRKANEKREENLLAAFKIVSHACNFDHKLWGHENSKRNCRARIRALATMRTKWKFIRWIKTRTRCDSTTLKLDSDIEDCAIVKLRAYGLLHNYQWTLWNDCLKFLPSISFDYAHLLKTMLSIKAIWYKHKHSIKIENHKSLRKAAWKFKKSCVKA